MKVKSSFFIFMIVAAIGCDQTSKNHIQQINRFTEDDAQWKSKFKDLVMCHCVLAGIDDRNARNKIMETDKTLYDPVDFLLEDSIKKILIPVIYKIKQDSVISLTTVGEGAQGKHIFSTCLQYYRSKALDSATKMALQSWKRLNVDSLMAVKATAY